MKNRTFAAMTDMTFLMLKKKKIWDAYTIIMGFSIHESGNEKRVKPSASFKKTVLHSSYFIGLAMSENHKSEFRRKNCLAILTRHVTV